MTQMSIVTDTAEWKSLCTQAFVPLDVDARGDFFGSVSSYALGDTSVVAVTNNAASVVRSKALVREHPSELVVVDVHMFGHGTVSGANNVDITREHSVVVCDTNRPYRLQFFDESDVVAFSFPRSRLALSDSALAALHARSLDGWGASSTVLRHLLQGVVAGGNLDRDEGTAVADAAVALIRSVFVKRCNTDRRDTTLDDATAYVTVCGFLRSHHADPDLSIDAVAKHHRMSRRYLEMLFSRHDESPAAYLRGARMLAALRYFETDPAPGVNEVAHRVGYRDVTSFIRAYRRTFDETPGATRRRFKNGTDVHNVGGPSSVIVGDVADGVA